MIPVLYDRTETEFSTNGLGRLSDAISCTVTEARNGEYELSMQYPIDGIHYADIEEGRIIYAKPSQMANNQPFVIYKISRAINGTVVIYAEHISYRLSKIVTMPFEAGTVSQALAGLKENAVNDCPFNFSTDKLTTQNFKVEIPKTIRNLLGGEDGSILDVYGGGEYEFDGFDVILHENRGMDNGVSLRYGKNLTELVRDSDVSNVYTGIVPYYQGPEANVVLPEKVVYSEHRSDFDYDIIRPVDLSSSFESPPTEEQLRTRAESYVHNNEGWKINENFKVSFAALWQTEEYKDITALERVGLCDTVSVYYEALGVAASAKVIRTEYNVLTELYNSIELGQARTSLSRAINQELEEELQQTKIVTLNVIQHQADLLRGGLGGYMVINSDEDGKPRELLFMNTPDINTATQCLRINMNGIGFSPGYNATPETAWTLDGVFSAKWIQTDTMSADRVRTGTIQSVNGNIVIDLDDDYLTIDSPYFRLTQDGTIITRNSSNITQTAQLSDGALAFWNGNKLRAVFGRRTNGEATIMFMASDGQSVGGRFDDDQLLTADGYFKSHIYLRVNNSWSDIGSRLASAESNINTINGNISTIASSIQTMVGILSDHERRITALGG